MKAIVLMHTKILNFWNLEIDENVIINQYCMLDCRRYKIIIKNNVDIGPYTKIWTLGHDPDDNDHNVKGASVIIKDHVWIASGVTILPGVIIEKGAIAAASSVIVKNVIEKSIVAGNPAKHIRFRKNDLYYTLNYKPIFE